MRTRGPDPLGARTQTEHEAQVSSLEDIVGSVRKYGEPPPPIHAAKHLKPGVPQWPPPSRGGSVSGWVWSRCGGYLEGGAFVSGETVRFCASKLKSARGGTVVRVGVTELIRLFGWAKAGIWSVPAGIKP